MGKKKKNCSAFLLFEIARDFGVIIPENVARTSVIYRDTSILNKTALRRRIRAIIPYRDHNSECNN